MVAYARVKLLTVVEFIDEVVILDDLVEGCTEGMLVVYKADLVQLQGFSCIVGLQVLQSWILETKNSSGLLFLSRTVIRGSCKLNSWVKPIVKKVAGD